MESSGGSGGGSGGVPLSIEASPMQCPLCSFRAAVGELRQHVATRHAERQREEDVVHDDEEDDSQQLREMMSAYAGKRSPAVVRRRENEEEEEPLSLGLMYQSESRPSIGVDEGDESQRVFVPPVPVYEVVDDAAAETGVVSTVKRPLLQPAASSSIAAIVASRRAAVVIDVDEGQSRLATAGDECSDGPLASEEYIDDRRPFSSPPSSVPDPVDEPVVGVRLELDAARAKREALELADLKAFAARNAAATAAADPKKAKRLRTDDEVWLDDDDKGKEEADEGIVEEEAAAGSSLSQGAVALQLAGSSRSTRRRRKDVEKLVGSEMLSKRSAAAQFAELEKRAVASAATPEKTRKKRSRGKPVAPVSPLLPEPAGKRAALEEELEEVMEIILTADSQEVVNGDDEVATAVALRQHTQPTAPVAAVAGGDNADDAPPGIEEIPMFSSQVPSEQSANHKVYDLSAPSQLLPMDAGDDGVVVLDVQDEEPAEGNDRVAAAAAEFAVPAPSRPKGKPHKSAHRGAIKVVRAARDSGSVAAGWQRGHIQNNAVLYCEAKNPRKLFAGFQFIVTGCKVVNERDAVEKHVQYLVDVELNGEKRRMQLAEWLSESIQFHGGREILDGIERGDASQQHVRLATTIEPVSGTAFSCNTLLVSEKPHRTVKWMMAVAAGVPCVKWKWVHECVREKKLMDWRPYLLKIGYSLVTDSLLPYRSRPHGSLVFDRKKFEVFGGQRFKQHWSMILREQGAECVSRIDCGNEGSLDYLLSEQSTEYPTKAVRAASRRLKIPLVSIEFVVQCILNHRLLKSTDSEDYVAKTLE